MPAEPIDPDSRDSTDRLMQELLAIGLDTVILRRALQDAWRAGYRRGLAAATTLPGGTLYAVRAGETLAGIALRQLGETDRWVALRDANAEQWPNLGPHDMLPVGTLLQLPPDSPR